MKDMHKDIQEHIIIDYLNGELEPSYHQEVEKYIADNTSAQKLVAEYRELYGTIDNCAPVAPSSGMSNGFQQYLDQAITDSNQKKGASGNNHLKQILLLGGLLLIGLIIGLNLETDAPMQLENHQFAQQEDGMLDLLNEASVSNRLRAVNMSTYTELPDDAIIQALSKTLLSDKSDHVRLASVEALAKFTTEKGVRNTLINALEKETDETVQIALINLLASIKEKDAMESFDKIIQNRNAVDFVKNEAHSGKLKLIETY